MPAHRPLAFTATLLLAAFTTASAATVTDVCKLPVPGNDGKVIGHDVGWSAVHGGASWFFFGDTLVDRNNNGVWNEGIDRFVAGTILARTTDTNPGNCLDLSYKVDGSGEATPLIPKIVNETYVWPEGPISLGSSFYTYYSAHEGFPAACVNGFCKQSPDAMCPPQPCPTKPGDPECQGYLIYRGAGLAKITAGSTATATTASRIPGYFFGRYDVAYGNPIQIIEQTPCGATNFVYLFGTKQLGCWGPSEVHLARVPTASIEDRTKYQFWGVNAAGNKAWLADPNLSTPIFGGDFAFTFNAHYDESAQRFIGTYSCGFLASKLCVAWAGPTGKRAAALTGTWTGGEIYDCPGDDIFECYQAWEHSQYASGNVAYMTSARNHDGEYWVNLRRVDFGPGH